MRPTLSEQIEGARPVLVELAAPEVDDPYVREQMEHAAAALGHAASRWRQVLPDLVTDIRALEQVLGVAPRALPEAAPGVVDHDAADERHRELRDMLADAIANGPEPSPAVRAYLIDSIERL